MSASADPARPARPVQPAGPAASTESAGPPESADPDHSSSDVYLAGLRLRGRSVVVAGAGHVVARRLPALRAAGADLTIVAPRAHPDVVAAARAGLLAWRPRPFAPSDLDDAWYAMAATDSAQVNADVVAAAEARRVFCVRADDGARGSAVTPAAGHVDGLHIGVVSGGDFRRSRRVRDELLALWRAC